MEAEHIYNPLVEFIVLDVQSLQKVFYLSDFSSSFDCQSLALRALWAMCPVLGPLCVCASLASGTLLSVVIDCENLALNGIFPWSSQMASSSTYCSSTTTSRINTIFILHTLQLSYGLYIPFHLWLHHWALGSGSSNHGDR